MICLSSCCCAQIHSLHSFIHSFARSLTHSHSLTLASEPSMSGRQSDYRRGPGGGPPGGGGYRDRSRSPDRNRPRDNRDTGRFRGNGRDYRDSRDGRDGGRDARDNRDGRDYRYGRDSKDDRDGRDSYRDSRFPRDDRTADRSESSSKPDGSQDTAMDVDQSAAPAPRKVPISIEELIKQKEQEKLALEKVCCVF